MKKSFVIGILLFLMLIAPMLAYCQGEAEEQAPTQEQESLLEQQLEIPKELQFLARLFFGLKPETPVTFQEFIILIMTFAIFFWIIRDIIIFIPFFDTTLKSIIGAILVALLAGLSGGFLLFADLVLSLGSLFGLLEQWPIVVIVMIFVLLFGIGFILNKILADLKRKSRISEAEIEGFRAGASVGLFKKVSKSFR